MAGRGRGVQRLPRRGGRAAPCCSTAAAACSASCAATASTGRSTRSSSPTCTPTTSSTSCPYASALTYAPRQQPVPVGGHPGTDTPARPRLIAPAGAAEAFRQVCAGSGMRAEHIEQRVRADRVRAGGHVRRSGRSTVAFRPVPHFLPDERRRAARGRRAADLQRRLRAQRRAGGVRARHLAAADRGHAAAPGARRRARAPDARRRPASTAGGPARGASCSRTSPTSSTPSGRAGRPSGASAGRSTSPARTPSTSCRHSCTAFGASCR